MLTMRHIAESATIFSSFSFGGIFWKKRRELDRFRWHLNNWTIRFFCRLYPHFLLGNLPALPFCLSVCSFLYFFLRLCRRFCFCLSPPLMSKRIKKEKATGSYLLVPVSAPFCLSIDQVREKDNAILLFVCCSNKCRRVAMLAPNFVSFSLFLISLWWLEWKSLSGCAKRQWTEREFSFGAIESHDVVWLFVYSGRSLAVPSRFVISSIHPIDSRNYRQTYTYHLDI